MIIEFFLQYCPFQSYYESCAYFGPKFGIRYYLLIVLLKVKSPLTIFSLRHYKERNQIIERLL